MAERDSPHSPSQRNPRSTIQDPASNPTQPIFEAGTYVVQVPKDQIYRVPPPENAYIAQRHRNPQQKKRNPRCSCFMCCFIGIALVLVFLALAMGLLYVFLKPKNPEFQVQRVVVSSKTSHSEYNITLKIDNPNGKSRILFKQDGVTALSFREHKIASGKFPTFHQDQQNLTKIGIFLKGASNAKLPKDIQKIMNKSAKSKVHLSLLLNLDVPVRMKTSSFATGDAKLVVACEFTVDTLSKGTRVLLQECQTDR